MPSLQRAKQADQKIERYHAILDAAERMWLAHPERMASVAEVAEHAGVGKGTVYLYFPSKEELLLALHSRHVEKFFQALLSMLAQSKPVTVEQILRVVKTHMIAPPAFLPLANRCFALMEKSIPPESAAAFHQGIAQWLQRAGGELSRHFKQLNNEQAVSLLMQSYGLIVGLWQLLNPALESSKHMTAAEKRILRPDYAQELSSALFDLWAGRLRFLELSSRQKTKARPNLKSGAKTK
ncbi:MAG: TetR/AcrR family transcriptional regulator [Burkholderiales bacterium]